MTINNKLENRSAGTQTGTLYPPIEMDGGDGREVQEGENIYTYG